VNLNSVRIDVTREFHDRLSAIAKVQLSEEDVHGFTQSQTEGFIPQIQRPQDFDWAKRSKLDVSAFLSDARKKRYANIAEPLVRDWFHHGRGDGSLRELAYKYKLDSAPTAYNILVDVAEHAADPLLISRVLGAKFSGFLLVDGKYVRIVRRGLKKEMRVVFTLLDALTLQRFSRRLILTESKDFIEPMFREFRQCFGEPIAVVQDFSDAITASREKEFPNSIAIGDPYHQMKIIDKILGTWGNARNRTRWQLYGLARGFVDAKNVKVAAFYWSEINNWRSEWLKDEKCKRILGSLETHKDLLMNKFKLVQAGHAFVHSNGVQESLNKSLNELQRKLGGAFHNETNAVYLINLWTAFEQTTLLTTGPLKGYSTWTKQGFPPDIDYLATALNATKFQLG